MGFGQERIFVSETQAVSTFRAAKLVDGTVLTDVTVTRAQGYDTQLLITDGDYIAPLSNVVYLKRT